MTDCKGLCDLDLDDILWESLPWEGRIKRVRIVRKETTEFVESCKPPVIRLYVDGGFLGSGELLDNSNWMKRYFPDKEMCRQACVEESVRLKEEKRQQVEAEIARLRSELE